MQIHNDYRALQILHRALLLGLLLLAGLSFLNLPKGPVDRNFRMIFQAIAAGASIITLLAGFSMFSKKLVEIRNSTEDRDAKIVMYRSACILWWAMIEGPGLLAIVGFILTGDYALFALGLFQAGLLAVFMPRKGTIALLLNLSVDEVRQWKEKSK